MNEMLSLRTQEFNVDYIFTKIIFNEIISRREVIIITECNIVESIALYTAL